MGRRHGGNSLSNSYCPPVASRLFVSFRGDTRLICLAGDLEFCYQTTEASLSKSRKGSAKTYTMFRLQFLQLEFLMLAYALYC